MAGETMPVCLQQNHCTPLRERHAMLCTVQTMPSYLPAWSSPCRLTTRQQQLFSAMSPRPPCREQLSMP